MSVVAINGDKTVSDLAAKRLYSQVDFRPTGKTSYAEPVYALELA